MDNCINQFSLDVFHECVAVKEEPKQAKNLEICFNVRIKKRELELISSFYKQEKSSTLRYSGDKVKIRTKSDCVGESESLKRNDNEHDFNALSAISHKIIKNDNQIDALGSKEKEKVKKVSEKLNDDNKILIKETNDKKGSAVTLSNSTKTSESFNPLFDETDKRIQGQVFICNVCGKPTKTRTNLKIHMETHAIDQSYSCKNCGKSFRQRAGLIQHMNIHNDTFYSCEWCPKKYKNAANLCHHRKVHMKDSKIRLEIQSAKLLAKQRGKKEYACSVCHKVLSRNALLIEHMNVHNNLRPNRCDQCPKAFAGKANLLRHKKLHQKKGKSESDEKSGNT